MFPASTMAGGQCMGMPDTCLTPAPPAPNPIPIPYPNISMCMQSNPSSCTKKVKVANMPAVVVNSQIMMSNGDEAGVNGGVVSHQNMGPTKFKRGSMKVKFESKNACFITSTVGQNGNNANMPAGAQVAPSQVTVLIAS